MRGFTLAAAALLLGSASGGAQAKPADIAPAVAGSGRPADAVALDGSRKPAEVLRFLGLEQGDRALDLFAGSGYYTEIMARAVGPKGLALGWDPANFMNDKGRAAWAELKARVPNTGLMVTPADAFALPTDAFDFVLLHMVYHDTYWQSEKYRFPRIDPAAFLRTVYAATKPGGTVGVIDHVAASGGETRDVVEKLHRIDPARVRADFEAAGFVFDGESDVLRIPADDHSKNVFDPAIRGKTDRFVYRFRKPAR
ncbi:methyltransferase domain-containing protein [Sphingomonas parva]|uniref:Methyltransferase domain-containing protein n=1 Tax=Sphingomonas parva TaxID=2555898 RepID=A0A4Y8ZSS5_9SPHN|nr:methyltransferase domain-containing protein [Sphingomonas parva]TFI59070.1 methyltransferase domain-containing protein [Sphingomonas parva]